MGKKDPQKKCEKEKEKIYVNPNVMAATIVVNPMSS